MTVAWPIFGISSMPKTHVLALLVQQPVYFTTIQLTSLLLSHLKIPTIFCSTIISRAESHLVDSCNAISHHLPASGPRRLLALGRRPPPKQWRSTPAHTNTLIGHSKSLQKIKHLVQNHSDASIDFPTYIN